MNIIDFNNKTFLLIGNSENGKATSETIFKYQQKESLVTADYFGGGIKYGKIIAHLQGLQLHMLYQCITENDELKAGKAIAEISFTKSGKIKLKLNWEWLGDKKEIGTSEYIEN